MKKKHKNKSDPEIQLFLQHRIPWKKFEVNLFSNYKQANTSNSWIVFIHYMLSFSSRNSFILKETGYHNTNFVTI